MAVTTEFLGIGMKLNATHFRGKAGFFLHIGADRDFLNWFLLLLKSVIHNIISFF